MEDEEYEEEPLVDNDIDYPDSWWGTPFTW